MSEHAPFRDDPVVAKERPELLMLTGLLGMIGTLGMAVGTVVMQIVVPGHDPVSETISDLGRGHLANWMDFFFYLNAAGLLALAIGTAHVHLGRWAWSAGVLVLALTALDVTLLGLWDTFYGSEAVEKVSVHTRLAALLFPLFLAGPLAMAGGAGRISGTYRWLFLFSGGLWGVLSLAYWFSPDGIDGAVERGAGVVTLLWTVPLGWILFERGRSGLGRTA